MRILQILPELKSGGVERGTVDFAQFLKSAGHHSVVISAGGPLVADLESAGVTHYKLPVHKNPPGKFFNAIRRLSKLSKKKELKLFTRAAVCPLGSLILPAGAQLCRL